MKMNQHCILYLMATYQRYERKTEFLNHFSQGIQWIILPDVITAYIPKQASHFEESSDGTDIAYMEFPDEVKLNLSNKKNARKFIKYHIKTNKFRTNCAVSEKIHLEEFDKQNYSHPEFHKIRTHLIQDSVMNEYIRSNLVDVSDRLNDNFILLHDQNTSINGQQLQEQLNLFEEFGLLHLIGRFYKMSGILVNKEWLKTHVYPKINNFSYYPKNLIKKAISEMQISDEMDERINKYDFAAPDVSILGLKGQELTDAWDEIYSQVCMKTFYEV